MQIENKNNPGNMIFGGQKKTPDGQHLTIDEMISRNHAGSKNQL